MLISKNFIRHYAAIVSLAFASACAVVSCVPEPAHAQIVNPAQPATGVPIAGTGITVSGQTVSINYGLGSQTYTGNFNVGGTLTAGSFAPTSISTGALTATGTVSGAGFSNLFAAAYPIGSTTPNTGAFTNLAASGTVSGTGFSSYLAAPPAIGGTTPNVGSFTNLSSNGTASLATVNTSGTTTNTGPTVLNGAVSGTGATNLVAFTQSGTAAVTTSLQAKAMQIVSAFDFMTAAQITDYKSCAKTIDLQPALQAALNATSNLWLPPGCILLNSALVTTTEHQIYGSGFNTTMVYPSFTTGPWLQMTPPSSDTHTTLMIRDLSWNSKYGIQIGGTATSQPTDGAIIGGRLIAVGGFGTYGSGSGDSAYNTDQVRDPSNNLVSSYSGSTLAVGSALNTYNDVVSYGYGIRLTKVIDFDIEAPQLYGFGVGISLLGSDLVRINGGRIHEVGLFFYSQRIGSWGSQSMFQGTDLLHNRRAGGLLYNGTKFDSVTKTYYECYSNSALQFFWENTEGELFDDNRIDDPYYTGGGGTASGTTPIGLLVSPNWNNKFRSVRFQKFSAFTVPTPPIRVTGSMSSIDTNHTEAIAIENPSGYQPFGYQTPIQFGSRIGALDMTHFNPNNMPTRIAGSGFAPLAILDGTKWVIYNSTSGTATAVFPTGQLTNTPTLYINGKVTSGTNTFVTVTHNNAAGTSLETVYSNTVGPFNTTAFLLATQALTMTVSPNVGDTLQVSWTQNTIEIGDISIH